jgi:hypothetical protein
MKPIKPENLRAQENQRPQETPRKCKTSRKPKKTRKTVKTRNTRNTKITCKFEKIKLFGKYTRKYLNVLIKVTLDKLLVQRRLIFSCNNKYLMDVSGESVRDEGEGSVARRRGGGKSAIPLVI